MLRDESGTYRGTGREGEVADGKELDKMRKRYLFLLFVLVLMCRYSDAVVAEISDFMGKLSSKEYKDTKYYYYIPEAADSRP